MQWAALDTPLTIGAAEHLANDGNPDRDSLTIVVVSDPDAAGGSVALSGDVVAFTPAAGFAGMTRFNYDLVDTNRATVVDGRASLEPSGTKWRKLSLREPLTVGTDTVLRFTFGVGQIGKIMSIASIPATSTARRRIGSCYSSQARKFGQPMPSRLLKIPERRLRGHDRDRTRRLGRPDPCPRRLHERNEPAAPPHAASPTCRSCRKPSPKPIRWRWTTRAS